MIHNSRVQFYYGNKSSNPIRDFHASTNSTSELEINESQTAPTEINQGAQVLQILQIQCQKVRGQLGSTLLIFF